MIKMQRTVSTRASAEVVFDYLADFSNAAEWDPNAVRVVVLSGDGEVGTTYRVTSKFAGRTTDLDYELTERRPHTLIELKGEKKSITAVDTITVAAAASSGAAPSGSAPSTTEVTYAVNFSFHGILRIFEPLLRVAVSRLFADGAKGLSARLAELE